MTTTSDNDLDRISPEQYYTLCVILASTSCALSFFGSGAIVISSYRRMAGSIYQRLIFMISIWDVIGSFMNFIHWYMIPRYTREYGLYLSSGNATTCSIVGYSFYLTPMLVSFYSFYLSLYFYCKIKYNILDNTIKQRHYMILSHGIALLISFLVASLGLFWNGYEPRPFWNLCLNGQCIIGVDDPTTTNCGTTGIALMVELLFTGTVMVLAIASMICTIGLYNIVKFNLQKSNKYHFRFNNNNPNRTHSCSTSFTSQQFVENSTTDNSNRGSSRLRSVSQWLSKFDISNRSSNFQLNDSSSFALTPQHNSNNINNISNNNYNSNINNNESNNNNNESNNNNNNINSSSYNNNNSNNKIISDHSNVDKISMNVNSVTSSNEDVHNSSFNNSSQMFEHNNNDDISSSPIPDHPIISTDMMMTTTTAATTIASTFTTAEKDKVDMTTTTIAPQTNIMTITNLSIHDDDDNENDNTTDDLNTTITATCPLASDIQSNIIPPIMTETATNTTTTTTNAVNVVSDSSTTSMRYKKNQQQKQQKQQKQNQYRTTAEKNKLRMIEVRNQGIMYAIVYLNSFFWVFIKFIFDKLKAETNITMGVLVLSIMCYIFFPIQGFFNFIVYTTPRYKEFRKKYPNSTRMKALYLSLTLEPASDCMKYFNDDNDSNNNMVSVSNSNSKPYSRSSRNLFRNSNRSTNNSNHSTNVRGLNRSSKPNDNDDSSQLFQETMSTSERIGNLSSTFDDDNNNRIVVLNDDNKDDDVANHGHHQEQEQDDDSDNGIRRQSRTSFKMIDPAGYMLPVIHQAADEADEDETEHS